MWRYLGIFFVLFLVISTSSSENNEVINQAQMKCETMCNERQNTSAILWKLYKHINRLEGQSEVHFITTLEESDKINKYLKCAYCLIEYLQSENEVKINTYRSYLETRLKIPLLKLQKTVETINTTRFNSLKNGDLETQLQIKEIKLANLTNEIEECSSQLHDLYYNITVRDNQINDLKAQINKTALELKQLDELRNKTLQNNAALRDKDNEIANLKVELKKLQAKPAKQEKCQSEITACQKKTTNLDAEIKTKIKEIDDLKSRNDKSLGECQAERNELKNQAEDTLKNLEYCNKTLNALKIESTGRDKQLKTFDEQNITSADAKIKLRDCESKLQKPLPQPMLPILTQKVTPPQQRSCQNSNGIISIRIPSNDEFPVLCTHNVMGSGWITILNRFDGSLNFTQPWKKYRNGFGDLSGEFFLGLQKIYLITNSQPHELYIKLIDENNYQYYASYDNFQIGNEQSQFKLESLGHFYNSNVWDALSYSINKAFLTYDSDKRQCASQFGGGWWYGVKNCRGAGNLHGNYDGNLEWFDVLRRRYLKLKSIRMMIRPKSTTSRSYG